MGDEPIFTSFIQMGPLSVPVGPPSTTFAFTGSHGQRPRARLEFRYATSEYARRPECNESIFQAFTCIRRSDTILHISCKPVAIFGAKNNGERQTPIRRNNRSKMMPILSIRFL